MEKVVQAVIKKYEKAKETLIEATWAAIMESAENEAVEGELAVKENTFTQYGLCNIYYFTLKGDMKAVLIQTLPDYTWLIQSESAELKEKIMQEYGKRKKEKVDNE